MNFSVAVEQLEHGEVRAALELLDRVREEAQQLEDLELRTLILHRVDFEVARAYLAIPTPLPEELAQAEACLQRFLDAENDPNRRALALAMEATLHARLQAVPPTSPPAPSPPPPPVPRASVGAPIPVQTKATLDLVTPTSPVAAAPNGRGLVIGGGVALGAAVASVIVMIVGATLAQRAEDDYRAGPTRERRNEASRLGRTANRTLVGAAAASGALLIAGSSLLAIGFARRKRASASKRPAL